MCQSKDSAKLPRFCNVRTFIRFERIKTTDDIDFVAAGVPF